MKKIIIVLLALSLIGCAAMQKTSDFICAPTPDQQATATAMLAALDAAQSAGAIFFPVIGIAKASAVLKVIQGGGCFLLAELKEAIAAVDAANAAKMQAKGPRFAATTKLPEYPALRRLVK